MVVRVGSKNEIVQRGKLKKRWKQRAQTYGQFLSVYWCLYRHQCDLPEHFGKKKTYEHVYRKRRNVKTLWRNVM